MLTLNIYEKCITDNKNYKYFFSATCLNPYLFKKKLNTKI